MKTWQISAQHVIHSGVQICYSGQNQKSKVYKANGRCFTVSLYMRAVEFLIAVGEYVILSVWLWVDTV